MAIFLPAAERAGSLGPMASYAVLRRVLVKEGNDGGHTFLMVNIEKKKKRKKKED
jgi:hypothetical protein